MPRDLPPIHPSEVLKEDFMLPFNLTAQQLAQGIHIPVKRLNDFLAERQPLTADLALRLARYFGTDPQSWLNLQNHYDLEVMQDTLHNELENEIKPLHIVNA
jgi:addiction module HigA family antidote